MKKHIERDVGVSDIQKENTEPVSQLTGGRLKEFFVVSIPS